VRPVLFPSFPHLSAKTPSPYHSPLSSHRHHAPTVDEALKLNIEDKDDSSPRRPSAKRARPAEEHQAPAAAAAPTESTAPEGAGRPKRKAAPAPATETPVKSRGKKAKTDATTTAPPPASKGKKSGTEKKAGAADDEATKDQQEADEVDALADEPAENGEGVPGQGPYRCLLLISRSPPGHPSPPSSSPPFGGVCAFKLTLRRLATRGLS
jgi:hypothetical protein